MKWPLNKEFAFTIIDDTDNSTVENIGPIYEYLSSRNIKTTKTVWIFPSRDRFTGQSIQDNEYLNFIFKIEQEGFEIQIHNVGSGDFKRQEIIEGFNIFKETFGRFPTLHCNHSSNPDNIYWGYKRYGSILKFLIGLLNGKTRRFYGDEIESDYFWGDLSKKYIKYIRNRVFNGINTLHYDPQMPYIEKNKKYTNYWFSASDGHTVEEFNNLTSKKNIDRLKKMNGLCIVYTHFASGFIEQNGEMNRTFMKNIDYLSSQNVSLGGELWALPALLAEGCCNTAANSSPCRRGFIRWKRSFGCWASRRWCGCATKRSFVRLQVAFGSANWPGQADVNRVDAQADRRRTGTETVVAFGWIHQHWIGQECIPWRTENGFSGRIRLHFDQFDATGAAEEQVV